MRLSTVQRKVLNAVQNNIPLDPRPFKILSGQLGMDEGEFIQTVKDLWERGIIRNFSAGLNHTRLGFKSTLVGLRVPPARVVSVAADIAKNPEVTHCFLRDGDYNLWSVFIYLKKERLKRLLNKLARKLGKENILNLPTRRKFKLRTRLKV